MTGRSQQNEQELRAARPMFRVLTILAAIVALAVSAAPASAGLLSSPLGASGTRSGGEVISGFIMKDGNICDPIRHMGC